MILPVADQFCQRRGDIRGIRLRQVTKAIVVGSVDQGVFDGSDPASVFCSLVSDFRFHIVFIPKPLPFFPGNEKTPILFKGLAILTNRVFRTFSLLP